MLIYQQRLEAKQNILARFVDIGTDLFVISCVCSYALSLAKQKEIPSSASPIELADLFCRQAKPRITLNFQDVRRNDDKMVTAIAKKFLNGSYEWLENEIIRPW